MNKRDYYFKQRVSQGDLDQSWDWAEDADHAMMEDNTFTGIVSGMAVSESGPPDLNVHVSGPATAYDKDGQRIYIADVDTVVDCSVDEFGVSTAVTTPGESRIVSVFARFKRNPTDPEVDGNSLTVYTKQWESAEYFVRMGSPSAGTPTPPALLSDALLVIDLDRAYGQTSYQSSLNFNYDRREDWYRELGTVLTNIGTQTWGTAKAAITDLYQRVDVLSGATGIPFTPTANWHTGSPLVSTNVGAAINEIVSSLADDAGAACGSDRIGSEVITSGGITLPQGSIRDQLVQAAADLDAATLASANETITGQWTFNDVAVFNVSAATGTNLDAITSTGKGTGRGVYGIGGANAGPGIYGKGGASATDGGVGVVGEGTDGATNPSYGGHGGVFTGGDSVDGFSGAGVKGTGGAMTGSGTARPGVWGIGGAAGVTGYGVLGQAGTGTVGIGVRGEGLGTGYGVQGIGGANSGQGGWFEGGAPAGEGLRAYGYDGVAVDSGHGVLGYGGDGGSGDSAGGHGGWFIGGDALGTDKAGGYGVRGQGGNRSGTGALGHGGRFEGGANAYGVYAVGDGTGYGVVGVSGTTGAAGVSGIGGGSNARGVEGQGVGSGAGIYGYTPGTGHGVHGVGGSGALAAGVYGEPGSGKSGVHGNATAAGDIGVYGQSAAGWGVVAQGDTTSPNYSAFRIEPQDSAPGTTALGDVYVNSSDNKLYFHNGTAWKEVAFV
jgi:hypothetical protein